MTQLAIKGHPTRGNEIITLLKMLGGETDKVVSGNNNKSYYFINKENKIHYDLTLDKNNYIIFTLKQFEKEFPYKIGDNVKNARINDFIGKITNVRWDGNEKQIIYIVEWDDATKSTLPYFAKDLQPYKEEIMEEKTYLPYMDYDVKTTKTMKKEILPYFLTVYDSKENKHEIVATDGYEIKEENGKYYAVKKKPQYPETYEECCDILGRTLPINDDVEGYKWELIKNFQRILVCRDAYWKIAGENMKLGKSWEPDLQDKKQTKYVITNIGNNIAFERYAEYNGILSFPTSEIRDVFYINFEKLIEQCIKLL